MEKKIINMVIPLNDRGSLTLPVERILQFAKFNQQELGEDYIVLANPCVLEMVSEDTPIINIGCKKYSYEELTKIIDKYEQQGGKEE
ncbi:MAG: hypothetical protein AB9836_04645 [Aminipila sp.]